MGFVLPVSGQDGKRRRGHFVERKLPQAAMTSRPREWRTNVGMPSRSTTFGKLDDFGRRLVIRQRAGIPRDQIHLRSLQRR